MSTEGMYFAAGIGLMVYGITENIAHACLGAGLFIVTVNLVVMAYDMKK